MVTRTDDTLVDLRCSVLVTDGDRVLLLRRRQLRDWVLPGGRPRHGESMQSCARRETLEETGLRVTPARCAFVAEVIDPSDGRRIVDLVFTVDIGHQDARTLSAGEPGAEPVWVPIDDLRTVRLRPPIAGYLPALMQGHRETAAYLGNLWRPADADRAGGAP